MFRKFKDVSIAKKLYVTIGAMALLIGIELLALMFSLNTLSSLRAYVGGKVSGQRLKRMPHSIFINMARQAIRKNTFCSKSL